MGGEGVTKILNICNLFQPFTYIIDINVCNYNNILMLKSKFERFLTVDLLKKGHSVLGSDGSIEGRLLRQRPNT